MRTATLAKITRVMCHELTYGKMGLVTKVTIEFGEVEDNEDRHVPMVAIEVEYSGQPHHKVGDTFPSLAGPLLEALGK
jgi:hypothetical protein